MTTIEKFKIKYKDLIEGVDYNIDPKTKRLISLNDKTDQAIKDFILNEFESAKDEFNSINTAKQIVNKWLCQALDKTNGEMVRNACIVLQTLERKAYTDSLDISVTEDNGVYKVEAKSSYNNYEDSKVCYISKKSDGNLYVKFHEFSGLDGHLEGDSDYWGLNFALGAPSWMITSQEHEWDNVISKIINKLSSENLTTNA